MAGKEKEQKIGANISQESMRVIAETVGIASLPDEAASFLSEDVNYKLKTIIQDSLKHMHHSKRRKMSTADFDAVLKARNIEPIYGMHAGDHIPFRFTSGGGRELHFIEEKEMDLSDVINSTLPKVPQDISLKTHWLSIEGVQPSIPENPPAASKEQQMKEVLDTDTRNAKESVRPNTGAGHLPRLKRKHPNGNMVKIKDLSVHEMSVEQQFFFKEATEACVGPDENKRSEALNSLAMDPGLYQMLPRFMMFVSEGVKINVAQNNLALLIYLMRIVKSLLDNSTLYLERYLHTLMPAVVTCVVSKQLCLRPDSDNHWALRDFAARLMATICKNFNSNHNNIQSRVTKQLVEALTEKKGLSTHYGALAGLGELGPEVVKTCILPHLRLLGERMRVAMDAPFSSSVDKIACEHIKKQLGKYLPGVLKGCGVNETLEDYTQAYGYLGPLLLGIVQKERQAAVASTPTPARPTLQIHQSGRAPQQILIQQPGSASTPLTPSSSAFFSSTGPPTPRAPPTPSSATGQQKFVIVTSQTRPAAGSMSEAVSAMGGTSTPTIVKLVSAASSGSGVGSGSSLQAGSGQKIVVIQGANIKHETGGSLTSGGTASVVTPSSLAPVVVTTSQEMGMKSVFPAQTQPTVSFTVKKEEKP